MKHFKELIDSYGGWAMIDSNWNPENFHWEDAYVKANHLAYVWYSTFPFGLKITENFLNTSENILEVIKNASL